MSSGINGISQVDPDEPGDVPRARHQNSLSMGRMITVRAATACDAESVAAIRAASWQSAYAGIVPADVLARFTSPEAVSARVSAMLERWPSGIVLAETGREPDPSKSNDLLVRADGASGAPARPLSGQNAGRALIPAAGAIPIGFAHAGPEREHDNDESDSESAGSGEPAGQAGPRAELYAIYVLPEYWTAGAGHALMTEVLRQVRADGYAAISLWVLEENQRARRFYERAGFAVTGRCLALDWLGGTTEVQYVRSLSR